MRALQYLWIAVLAGFLGGCPKLEVCDNNKDDDRDDAVDCGDTDCTEAPECAVCGDENVTADEGCDDANTNPGDGCSETCAVEAGFECVGVGPGSCTAICGDGLTRGTEQCDDGNLTPGDFCDEFCAIETQILLFTGDSWSFLMPAWANALFVEAWGAQGGASEVCDLPSEEDGGLGGYASGILPVSAGAEVFVFVGGKGTLGAAGGYNGGGAAGQYGGSGGGASDVRLGGADLDHRVLVAGGGGGGNSGCPDHGAGGAGGGLEGEPGASYQGWPFGGGGTQASGGAGGAMGQAGSFGLGGSFVGDPYHVAGGGGGWFGGGSAFAAGGGGGSSFIVLLLEGETEAGVRTGDGLVIVTPLILE